MVAGIVDNQTSPIAFQTLMGYRFTSGNSSLLKKGFNPSPFQMLMGERSAFETLPFTGVAVSPFQMKKLEPDYTKPSRLKRRRKKRWKIADGFVRGIPVLSLTGSTAIAMLYSPINRLARTITPVRQGVKTPNHGVFYCLKRIVTDKIRDLVMVACSGPLSSGPEPCPGGDNPLHVAAQRLSPFGGGLFTLDKEYRYE